ncbi:protein GOLM2 isoform X3 [Narcine bancroftii]|uniref:protein GOLM2 isoform X3 n=1 Tax=Narcine bancroftii TaxID=1343680 RepID=UPI00383175F6
MFGNNRRAGRLPSLLLLGLLVLAAVVAFNYWMVSSRNGRLQLELAELQVQVKKTDTAKSRLEKRNSELMGQVDTHRRRLDEKEDECHNLGNQLQSKENLMKKCIEEKIKFQNNVTEQLSFIHRLQEQLTELRQEFIRQDEQLQEYRRNSTSLEKKLEYESLQCGQQISALKEQCEEKIKSLGRMYDESPKLQEDSKQKQPREEELPNDRESDRDYKINAENVQQIAENNKPISLDGSKLQSHQDSNMKLLNQGKADNDAGMPGMEENEQGKSMDIFIDQKSKMNFEKPASQSGIVGSKRRVENDVKPGHHFVPDLQVPPKPALQHDSQLKPVKFENRVNINMPNPIDHKDPANVEDENIRVRTDEIEESQNQQPAGKVMRLLTKESTMQLPSNQALHFAPRQAEANHFYRQGGKGHEKPNEPRELAKGQGQFFDENESPADPQHDSKVADYNGDDGNVVQQEILSSSGNTTVRSRSNVSEEDGQDFREAANNPVYDNQRFGVGL